jgi:hypothetical protein
MPARRGGPSGAPACSGVLQTPPGQGEVLARRLRGVRGASQPPGQLVQLFGAPAPPHDEQGQKEHRQRRAHYPNRACVHAISFHKFRIIGSSSLLMRTITGPTVTTNSDGNMQKKIGNTSFTPSLAAFSSAIWRACTRM